MSDIHEDCRRFDEWLLEGHETSRDDRLWREHLDGCPGCRGQRSTHNLLVAAFETEPLPELSPDFDRRLAAHIDAGMQVRPLKGWRLAAMSAYALIAIAILSWALRNLSLPAIDLSSPWAGLLALALVPPSLALAIRLSRFLPSRTPGAC